MKKFLCFLGFKNKKYSWADFDYEIHIEFFKKIGFSIISFFALILFLLNSQYEFAIMSGLMLLCICVIIIHQYLIFAYEKYVLFIGEITFISLEEKKRLKKVIYGKSYAQIIADDYVIEFPINTKGKFKIGTKIALYALPNSISQKSGNLYVVHSPLAISVINQTNASKISGYHPN